MNYLELAQKVNTLVGMQGSFDSISGATGYQATIATMVADSWMDIQNLRRDWKFLRDSVVINTVAGKSEYQISEIFGSSDPVGSWIRDMILYNQTSERTIKMVDFGYDRYQTGEMATAAEGEPQFYAIDPVDQHLYLNPPNAVYQITAHYFAKPTVLVSDADIPLAPVEFHYVIVYQAAAEFAAFLGNGDLFQIYSQKASGILGDLMRKTIRTRRVRTRGIA